MSLIVCTAPCVYQADGYCRLSRALSAGVSSDQGCVNYVPAHTEPLQQRSQRFPDVGHADQFQTLRDH